MRYDLIDRFTKHIYYQDLTKAEAISKAKELLEINGFKPTPSAIKDNFIIEKLLDNGELSLCKGIGYTLKEIEKIRYSSTLHKIMEDGLKELDKMFKF